MIGHAIHHLIYFNLGVDLLNSVSTVTDNTTLAKKKNLNSVAKWFKELPHNLYKTRYLQLLALPGLIYYIIFHYIPMYGVIIAFKDYKIKLGIMGSPWVGFYQFERFFNHPEFWRLIRNTLLLNCYRLIFTFPIPILFALLLNELRGKHYKKFVQTVSYLPHFISLPAIIGMLFMFLSPTDGVINNIIKAVGMEPVYFMAQPEWFRPLYILSEIWTSTGWGAIIYIAALSNVNSELYESAAMDGASRIKMMWHVSLPSIAPTVVIMLLLQVGRMMSLGSEKVLLMQSPITYETSDVISTFVYRRGLQYAEYSFSTAVEVFNSFINILLLTIANTVSSKLSDNSLW